jgi:quercetin dioxygenase-like cupin family protein
MPTQPTITVLTRVEFPNGYATVMVLIENVEGAPRHTHPGLETTYVLEGEFRCHEAMFPHQLERRRTVRDGVWLFVLRPLMIAVTVRETDSP